MSELLAAMYPMRDGIATVLAAVSIPEQEIKHGSAVTDTWRTTLWDLRDDLVSLRKILEAVRRSHGPASGFQDLERLMEKYEVGQADFKQGVEATEYHRIVPIPLQDHHHKARIFVKGPPSLVGNTPLAHALLEIGPTIAAQESDHIMARNIEDLGRMRDPTLNAIMRSRNYHEDEVIKVASDAQVLIETIRKCASDSIEFSDLVTGASQPPGCDPIRVVLECKLWKSKFSASSSSKLIEDIEVFERLYAEYDGSPKRGEDLIRALNNICMRAPRVCAPLYTNLELRMGSTCKSIAEFLRHPELEVSSLLQEMRAPSHSSSPSPALWQKTL